ncbi:MAG: PAS domain S-box protein [Alphaproteobacteria bacterium]|nr:PAS domain S-box protein [Alphaproteobacteria bacterium]
MAVLSIAPATLLRFGNLSFSIRGKFVALAVGIALFASLAIGGVGYMRVVDISLDREVATLEGQARLVVPQIKAAYDLLRSDALIVSQTPPFKGLARSMPNGDVDPRDGSTTEDWRRRLATIFTSVMAYHPEFVQMRYIGIADGGRELVRVDRRGEQTYVTPLQGLQRKGEESYFTEGVRLNVNEVYFSPITLNRDYGRIDHNLPVVRIVVPAFAPNGQLFGLLVINAHYEKFLRGILNEIHPDGDTYLLNDTGDYISKSSDGKVSALQFRGLAEGASPPATIRTLHTATTFDTTVFHKLDNEKVAIHVTKIALTGSGGARFLKIALVVPEVKLLAEAWDTRQSFAMAGALLVVFALLLALVSARAISQPLRQIVDEIRAFGGGRTTLNLPSNRADEIGELSVAFENMIQRLEVSNKAKREAFERLEAMRDEAVDALITTDINGTVLQFNKSAEKLFGHATADILEKNVSVLIPESHGRQHNGYLAKYRETGERDVRDEVRIVDGLRRDGSTFPAELRVSDIRVGSERFFNGIVRDISARIEMEKKIDGYVGELERSNRDLDDFAYIASHDLKEPLRGISNHVRFLQEDYEDLLGEGGKKRADRIRQLCQKADKLTTDLLEWSRLGRTAYQFEEIDTKEIVQTIIESLSEFLQEKKATVQIVEPLPTVKGDRARLSSVFQNLIVNGVKYNDSADKRIEIGFLTGQPAPDGGQADVFYVRDNGIGIAAEFHDTVFTIFKRLNSEKTFGAGTGAGLSFVKKIVERHGGRIWIVSKPGEGTTFYFSLKGSENAHS